MHMADALISPLVGGTMWGTTAILVAWCAHKVKEAGDDRQIPMMGVLGAFIFTAQMINFSIPATGSSGHLGGGLILSILLGPHAAFLVIASVLTVQALFFADGGLLALGCNIFNLGFFPAFIAFPFLYKLIAGKNRRGTRAWVASLGAAILGLQLGAFSVVIETLFSGISELPFKTFVLIMQPIHLAIGIAEGVTTAAVIALVARARPEVMDMEMSSREGNRSMRPVLTTLLVIALLTGGITSWFASLDPDGLEWAIAKVTGKEMRGSSGDKVHTQLAAIQEKTAFLPDYGFTTLPTGSAAEKAPLSWPAVNPGTSLAGIVGGLITLAFAALIGLVLRTRMKVKSPPSPSP